MSKLFDTHAHYFAEKFNELEGGADAILSSDMFKEKIGGVICVGSDPSNVHISTDLARKYDFMYAAVGIHPDDAQNMCKKSPDEEVYDCVESLIANEVTRKENKIVAIGEIGFDYFYKTADKPLQREYFAKQMSLAKKYGLPVIIHNRNAHGDTLDMLRRFPWRHRCDIYCNKPQFSTKGLRFFFFCDTIVYYIRKKWIGGAFG